MAGEIRQPIDLAALERYIDSHVKEIKVPIAVKQVCCCYDRTLAINIHADETRDIVWLWTIEPDVPDYG